MPDTFIKIASVTVGSGGASSIDFTSIPSTYTDLQVVHSLRGTNANVYQAAYVQFNNDTGSNYSYRYLEGSGSTAYSGSGTSTVIAIGNADGDTATANTFSSGQFYVPNYLGSNQKSISSEIVGETNASTVYMDLVAGLWTGTSAITSIKLFPAGGNTWKQYSTATLYGIKNS